jgi:hypothetical protein
MRPGTQSGLRLCSRRGSMMPWRTSDWLPGCRAWRAGTSLLARVQYGPTLNAEIIAEQIEIRIAFIHENAQVL